MDVKGLGDGMELAPLTTGVAVSLGLPTGCSPRRRRAAFKVASRVLTDSRGGSDMVEPVESESVGGLELVSEVESEADVVTDCGTGTEVLRSAG